MSANETPDADAGALLPQSTARLLLNLEALTDEALAESSLLPGWTRAHVIAHLALNAEGLTGVLDGLTGGRDVAMYSSPESRDSDIADLADKPANQVRERLVTAAAEFADRFKAMPADAWAGSFERTPGGPSFPAGAIAIMRWREVEIHHADLGTGYTSHDWPAPFVVAVLDSMRLREWPTTFTLAPTDLAQTWHYGAGTGGAPEVSGTAADLAWWVTGRGDGSLLSADHDSLPEVPAW